MTLVELNTSLEIWKAPNIDINSCINGKPQIKFNCQEGYVMYSTTFYSLALFKDKIIPDYVQQF